MAKVENKVVDTRSFGGIYKTLNTLEKEGLFLYLERKAGIKKATVKSWAYGYYAPKEYNAKTLATALKV